MKNKRAFLLAEETVKIIIALVCISFLVYFLSSLYFSNKHNGDLNLAKASLEHLISEINSKSENVDIYNPSSSKYFPGGWIVISFPLGSEKPSSCSKQGWNDCLCICGESTTTLTDSGLAQDCDSSGTCIESDFKIVGKKIRIENPPITLQINYDSKVISENGA